MSDPIIVTGCERAGTTIVAQELARIEGLPYVHETFTHEKAVMKHSLNMQQNIKHLELLDYLYPEARWYYVYRNPLDNIRSLQQKIWGRHPHTMSLDEAIQQYRYINDNLLHYIGMNLEMNEINYDTPSKYGFNYTPNIVMNYFTKEQYKYIESRL